MTRKLVCSMFVMLVAVAFVVADDAGGRILKVNDKEVTFQEYKGFGKKAEKVGDEKKFDATGAKVNKAKFNKEDKKFEVGEAIEGGLENKIFKDISEKGVNVRITYEGKKVSQILVIAGKGGK